MLIAKHIISDDQHKLPDDQVLLDHSLLEKRRFRVVSINGKQVDVFLERANMLSIGDQLLTECGQCVAVSGAPEPVITASTDDWQLFSRACYHLGNRHVKLQVGEKWLRITPDHVLESLLRQLGLSVKNEEAIFNPESGAYGKHHAHGHNH